MITKLSVLEATIETMIETTIETIIETTLPRHCHSTCRCRAPCSLVPYSDVYVLCNKNFTTITGVNDGV